MCGQPVVKVTFQMSRMCASWIKSLLDRKNLQAPLFLTMLLCLFFSPVEAYSTGFNPGPHVT